MKYKRQYKILKFGKLDLKFRNFKIYKGVFVYKISAQNKKSRRENRNKCKIRAEL